MRMYLPDWRYTSSVFNHYNPCDTPWYRCLFREVTRKGTTVKVHCQIRPYTEIVNTWNLRVWPIPISMRIYLHQWRYTSSAFNHYHLYNTPWYRCLLRDVTRKVTTLKGHCQMGQYTDIVNTWNLRVWPIPISMRMYLHHWRYTSSLFNHYNPSNTPWYRCLLREVIGKVTTLKGHCQMGQYTEIVNTWNMRVWPIPISMRMYLPDWRYTSSLFNHYHPSDTPWYRCLLRETTRKGMTLKGHRQMGQ